MPDFNYHGMWKGSITTVLSVLEAIYYYNSFNCRNNRFNTFFYINFFAFL